MSDLYSEIVRLRAQIAADRRALTRRIERLIAEPPPTNGVEGDHFALNAHHAYSALESVLERTARVVEGGVPQGSNWHQELLENAFLDLPALRPAVFSAATAPYLRELRGFRHLVRHAYDIEYDLDLLADRREQLGILLPLVCADLDRFDEFLAAIAAP